jgi:hypothetical protein
MKLFNHLISIGLLLGIQSRSQWPRGLMRGSAAARLLGLRVRIPPVAWMSVVSVVGCRVEVSASGWSLVQRSPTECDVSNSVIVKPRQRGGPGSQGAVAPWIKNRHSDDDAVHVVTLLCHTVLQCPDSLSISGFHFPISHNKFPQPSPSLQNFLYNFKGCNYQLQCPDNFVLPHSILSLLLHLTAWLMDQGENLLLISFYMFLCPHFLPLLFFVTFCLSLFVLVQSYYYTLLRAGMRISSIGWSV